MSHSPRAIEINRSGWNQVAHKYHGRTALPEYGPLTPTEDALNLLDRDARTVLELGCGSGHSLRYLAERGATDLWGIDLSPVQIAFARETLSPFAAITHLIESPMEADAGVPHGAFDLVFSLYGIGWTTDLAATLSLAHAYLRPGGSLLISGEHPAYRCLEWNGSHYTVGESYLEETPREHDSWKGVPIVTQRKTLASFINAVIQAGLCIETLLEPPPQPSQNPDELDPSRWYSIPRASLFPTTFILKARKPAR